MGAMKRGRGTCSTFKAFNLMYLHILRAGMVYVTLWYVHILLIFALNNSGNFQHFPGKIGYPKNETGNADL